MTNRIETLPVELQDKIYEHVFKLKFKDVLSKVQEINKTWQYKGEEYTIKHCLYNTTMSKKELQDYFNFIDWFSRKSPVEIFNNNRYFHAYYGYWDALNEYEYKKKYYIKRKCQT